MARVIAIGNNKGGTSKTTTAISLAGGLARKRIWFLLRLDAVYFRNNFYVIRS